MLFNPYLDYLSGIIASVMPLFIHSSEYVTVLVFVHLRIRCSSSYLFLIKAAY